MAKGRDNIESRSGENHWMKHKPERIAKGQAMGRSHLTDELVERIILEFMAGGINQRQLAQKHEMGYKNLNLILKRKTWKHVWAKIDYQKG